MKKFILKSLIGSLIFFGTGYLLYFFVNARSGLQVSSGDKLLASKWNELVSALSGVQTQVATQQTQLTTIQSKFTGESRINATLNSPWSNYGGARSTAQYYKDSFGIVHLKGLLTGGVAGTVVFVLPVGYRPISRSIFSTICNDTSARVDIGTNGAVGSVTTANATNYLSLEGITFRTY